MAKSELLRTLASQPRFRTPLQASIAPEARVVNAMLPEPMNPANLPWPDSTTKRLVVVPIPPRQRYGAVILTTSFPETKFELLDEAVRRSAR